MKVTKLIPAVLLAACAPVATITPVMPAISASGVTDMSKGPNATTSTWTDLVVPGFAPGAKLSVLSGDPGASGPYVIRLMFPDGYEFPEHWHPGTENLTVLSGSFHLAMVNPTPGPLQTYAPGDFIYIPPRMSHSGGAKGVTVIQLHGTGPFAINLGKP